MFSTRENQMIEIKQLIAYNEYKMNENQQLPTRSKHMKKELQKQQKIYFIYATKTVGSNKPT